MNPLLSEIVYILDRSGSMQPMQEAAVSAFNDFLAAQLTVPGQARLTLVQFDDAYEVPVAARDLREVPQLTAATYIPRGSTALLDAIGRAIQETDRRVEAMADPDKPAKVIVAVFTDYVFGAPELVKYSLLVVPSMLLLVGAALIWSGFPGLRAMQERR